MVDERSYIVLLVILWLSVRCYFLVKDFVKVGV